MIFTISDTQQTLLQKLKCSVQKFLRCVSARVWTPIVTGVTAPRQ
jgi:hypothetical protein